MEIEPSEKEGQRNKGDKKENKNKAKKEVEAVINGILGFGS